MRIDKRLNFVVPIYDADGKSIVAYVHSTPLSVDAIRRYKIILAQAFSQIFSRGLGVVGGPSVAMSMLETIATEQNIWEDDPRTGRVGVKHGVIDEIRRISNVAVPDAKGWQTIPFDVAVDRGFIPEEDKEEVENAIVFFILAYATLNRVQREPMINAAAELWNAQTSSLSSTEFIASLKTSSATVNTGEKSPATASADPGPATAMVDGKPASVPR